MSRKKKKIGSKIWAFAPGHIPLLSNGSEPRFTSHDKIAILNTGSTDAVVKIEIFYEDQNPITYHDICVKAKRMRKIWFNDLIDPLPVPLDTPFGFVITSGTEVIVQFSRVNTGQAALAAWVTNGYGQSI